MNGNFVRLLLQVPQRGPGDPRVFSRYHSGPALDAKTITSFCAEAADADAELWGSRVEVNE